MKKETERSTVKRQICARHWRYPDLTLARRAEGGLRLSVNNQEQNLLTHDTAEWPVITVITVVYNRVATLERAILSVLGQNYPALEYIIIDGGSTDGTLELIQKYQQQLAYYLSEPDGGIYDAINKGLSLAHGDYIGLLNSDDFYAPGFLQAAVRKTKIKARSEQSELGEIIYGRHIRLTEPPAPPEDLAAYISAFSLHWLGLAHGTFLVQRSAYEAIGPYSTKLRIASDHLWIDAALRQGIHFIPCLEYPAFFFSTNGISSTEWKAARKERAQITQGNLPFLTRREVRALVDYRGDFPVFVKVVSTLFKKYPQEIELLQAAVQFLRYQLVYGTLKSRGGELLWKMASLESFKDILKRLEHTSGKTGENILPEPHGLIVDFAQKVAAWAAEKVACEWLAQAIAEYRNSVARHPAMALELRSSFDIILVRHCGIQQLCEYYRSKISEPPSPAATIIPNSLISLATTPRRTKSVALTLASILQGSVQPEKILLWLVQEDQEHIAVQPNERNLPPELRALRTSSSGKLEIRFYSDGQGITSYSKIIPSLREFPDSIIITADDGVLYPSEWLEQLYQSYLREPESIHCHRAHAINFETGGQAMPYSCWDQDIESTAESSLAYFFISGFGVLFPPHSLHPDVLRRDLFLWLASDAADVWLNAMAVHQASKTRVVAGQMTATTGILGSLSFIPSLPGSPPSGRRAEQTGHAVQVELVYGYFALWEKVFANSLDADYLLERNEQKARQIQYLQNNRWYRFGQLSRKRKLWVIGKVLWGPLKIRFCLLAKLFWSEEVKPKNTLLYCKALLKKLFVSKERARVQNGIFRGPPK